MHFYIVFQKQVWHIKNDLNYKKYICITLLTFHKEVNKQFCMPNFGSFSCFKIVFHFKQVVWNQYQMFFPNKNVPVDTP